MIGALRDRDDLKEILRQPYIARIILSAVELDLFTPCTPGPASAARVAQACDVEARAALVMLEALAAMGLLERRDDGFSSGTLAARHLALTAPEPLHGMVFHYLFQWGRWSQLSEVVRSGRCLSRDAEAKRAHVDFVRALDDHKAHVSLDALLPIPLDKLRRVVDLGGGPGTLAVALARALPGVEVTLVDRPGALAVAEERVPTELWDARVIPRVADLCSDDPLGDGYDLAVLSAVLHAHPAQDAAWMVGKAARSLAPGGRLVIRELLLDDHDPARALDAAVFSVSLLINTEQGRSFRGDEVLAWMRAAGLVDLEVLPVERGVALVGRKPGSEGSRSGPMA